ncbi:MAG TPA: flavodoxin family protein [Methanothrix sp.]|nr:flavodoxin family protein [Methanothrix sp.]
MRILALVGSPRKGGNTEILVDEILKGAEAKGHVTERLRLYDYEILPCLDCRGCKRAKSGYTCALSDGMQEIYGKLERADIIIFGTPIYWYGPTAKMKLVIDRLRPYIASRKLSGKKGMVATPSEEGAGCCGPLLQMFAMSFDYLGMENAGSLLAQAYERGEIKKKPEELERAREMGKSL